MIQADLTNSISQYLNHRQLEEMKEVKYRAPSSDGIKYITFNHTAGVMVYHLNINDVIKASGRTELLQRDVVFDSLVVKSIIQPSVLVGDSSGFISCAENNM